MSAISFMCTDKKWASGHGKCHFSKQGQRDGELRAGCGANCEAHAWTSKLCNGARHLSSSSSSPLLRSRRIDRALAPRWEERTCPSAGSAGSGLRGPAGIRRVHSALLAQHTCA